MSDIRIETDEDGFYLAVDERQGPRHYYRIADPEALYDAVRAAIEPWLMEREAAKISARSFSHRDRVFACNPDESGGYDTSDPKHPAFHSTHADIWDARDKTEPRRGMSDMRRDLGRAPTAQEWQDERR